MSSTNLAPMELIEVESGGGACTVRLDGPESWHSVLLLPAAGDTPAVYDDVCARLHNSGLRTLVAETIDNVNEASVVGVLMRLQLRWVHVVGMQEGAALAWPLVAHSVGRFSGLIVDRIHPVVAGGECPAIDVPTTILVGNGVDAADAEISGRHVFADFRVVDLGDVDNIPAQASHELATEIVLRANPW